MRAGDLLPVLLAVATFCDPTDGNTKPVDFTGWTSLTFAMTGPAMISGAATGDDQGTLEYDWQPGDTAIPGYYQGVFRAVSPEGKPQSFPTEGALEIVIGS